jgi:hypothetical protein
MSAQVLTQNLAGCQGIIFITKYNSLEFHLLTPTDIILWGMGRKVPHKFFLLMGFWRPFCGARGQCPARPFVTPLPETPEYRDTFEVSLSMSAILLGWSIAIGDTFFGCITIDYRDTFRQYIANNPGFLASET